MAATKKQQAIKKLVKEVSIADLIGAVFAPSPADPEEAPPAPVQQVSPTQITPASPNDMVAIKGLAEETCELYDKIQELVGGLTSELAEKKKSLMSKMLSHGLKKVEVAGRPPVELTISNNKNSSKTAIVGVLGVGEGNNLWNKLPTRSSESLKIHPKNAPEG